MAILDPIFNQRRREEGWRVLDPIIHMEPVEGQNSKIEERSQEGFKMMALLALRCPT